MPPKAPQNNQKLSKQELKALKKQLKEKKKEEAKRLAEEKRRLAEEEAKRLEEEARIAWEVEQARLKVEHERILIEKEGLLSFFNWRSKALADFNATAAYADEWRRFVEAGSLPHASDEGRMNNFFNAVENSGDRDYEAALTTIKSIHKVFLIVEDLALVAKQKENNPSSEERFSTLGLPTSSMYHRYMKNLELLLQKEIDQTTASLLIRSHEIWKKTNEATFCAMSGGWKVYLWINHAKNPRVRVLNDPNLMITITLPKAFSFSSVAVRAFHQVLDPLLNSRNRFKSVGGIFVLDVLAIPPASRSSKGWTFEKVSLMTNSVVHLGYPFSGDGSGVGPGSTAVSPIGLEFVLPEKIIISEGIPEIGWWNEEEEIWEKEGISNVEYDKLTRILKFETIKAKSHAVIQSRVKYYPYQSWILNPVTENKAILTLDTHGNIIRIEVGSGSCKLLETPFPECKHIIGEELEPILLLQRLSRCGLHLMPEDDDAQFFQTPIKNFGLVVKEAMVEHYTCDDIALAIPTCAIASSKWNPIAGKDSCVVRILEIEELRFPPTFEKSKNIKTILYKAKGNGLLVATDKSTEYGEELLGEFHASILVTLRDVLSQASLEKIQKGEPSFTECFKCLALGLRLFSFTAIEPVKVIEDPCPKPSDIEPTEDACEEILGTSPEQTVATPT